MTFGTALWKYKCIVQVTLWIVKVKPWLINIILFLFGVSFHSVGNPKEVSSSWSFCTLTFKFFHQSTVSWFVFFRELAAVIFSASFGPRNLRSSSKQTISDDLFGSIVRGPNIMTKTAPDSSAPSIVPRLGGDFVGIVLLIRFKLVCTRPPFGHCFWDKGTWPCYLANKISIAC